MSLVFPQLAADALASQKGPEIVSKADQLQFLLSSITVAAIVQLVGGSFMARLERLVRAFVKMTDEAGR